MYGRLDSFYTWAADLLIQISSRRSQASWDLLFAVLGVLAVQEEAGLEGALWKERRWGEMDLLGRRGSMNMT